MKICHGCGGVVGRDCFNPIECEQITRSMAAEYQTSPDYNSQINSLQNENYKLKEINAEVIKHLKHATELIEEIYRGETHDTKIYKSIIAKSL